MQNLDMNYMVSNSKTRKGSISIELAITFSVFLLILSIFITAMRIHQTDVLMQASIEQTCEDISLLTPYSRIGSELSNLVINNEEYGDDVIDALSKINLISQSFSPLFDRSFNDMILNGTLNGFLRDDIASNIAVRYQSDKFIPSDIQVNLSLNPSTRYIDMYTSYVISTIFGDIQKNHYSVIPLYGDFFASISVNDKSDSNTSSVNPWTFGNFERGQYFREQYGANLPQTFPIVDCYDGSTITSITSIDLNARTYSNANSLISKLNTELEELNSFNGATKNIKGEIYSIDGSQIQSRKLVVIVPDNSDINVYNQLQAFAHENTKSTIQVEIVQSGSS